MGHLSRVPLAVCLLASCTALAAAAPSCTSAGSLVEVTQAQVPRCAQLTDPVTLRWGVQSDVITFAVEAQLPPGTSYLGIGLSEQGSMKGADIAVFNKTADGAWKLVDTFAEGFVRPLADESQDLKLLGVQYANDVLSASWQRHITPCDKQDLPVPSTAIHVIWAWGDRWGYHGSEHRGGQLLSLLEKEELALNSLVDWKTVNSTTKGLKVFDITYPVDIPAQETTYFIKYFKLPADRKYHIVHYEPITNHKMLHHGVASSCAPTQAAQVLQMENMGPFDRFKVQMLCDQAYLILASGSPNSQWTAPSDTGLPMGTPDRSVVALELHYNNPELLADQKDKGSGIRVYYTGELRKHDIGLITLNQQMLSIPPGQETVPTNVSVCPSQCTKRFKTPVTLLDGFFHMHDAGKSVIARRYRNGTELSPVGELRSWDYGFQGSAPIAPEARTLMPGDALTLQCTFDSRGRTNWTVHGAGTRDEMCTYWISYYPAQSDMGMCFSMGAMPWAICDAEPTGVLMAVGRRNMTATQQLMAQGRLLQAVDPARNVTPYQKTCSLANGTEQNNSNNSVLDFYWTVAAMGFTVLATYLLG